MRSNPRSYRFPFNLLLMSGFALIVAGQPGLVAAQDTDPTPAVNAAAPTASASEAVQNKSAEQPPRSREGFLPEPRVLTRAVSFGNRTMGESTGRVNNGFFPETSNMITGSGWISVGPGYRHWVLNDTAIAEGSAAISWRSYKMIQGKFEFPRLASSRLALGAQSMWMDATQITYFGVGPDTPSEDRSEYRMRTTDVVSYATVKPLEWLSIGGRGGWLRHPELLPPAGTFKRGNPATEEVFAEALPFTLSEQPNYLHADALVTADTRNARSYPTSGGVYRASYAIYSDRNASLFSFDRYEVEGAHFVPLLNERIVLAGHGWFVGTNTAADQNVPFYLMPSLGGGNTLRAYTDYRFHDRNLLLVNAESRFALFTHVDLAAFIDAGNVAAKVGDLDLAKRSYGAGLRLHSPRSTFARLDVSHGSEGWRFIVRTSDPLHLTRLSRRVPVGPFVP